MLILTNLGANDRTFTIHCPSENLKNFNIFLNSLIEEYDSYWFKTSSRRKRIRQKLFDYCVNHNISISDYKGIYSFEANNIK